MFCVSYDGAVEFFTRYGRNDAVAILAAVAEAFETEIFSEDEPQFWGFDTQEEWDAALDKFNKMGEEKFYAQLLKYLNGEPDHDISPGTIGETEAQIAQKLVAETPELMSPQNKDRLLSAIEQVYDREHAVYITLTDEQVALAKLMSTHEDDLPKA